MLQVSLILAKGTKSTAWQNSIQRKVATRKANPVLCILFTHTLFHLLGDYFKPKDSLIPFVEPANGTAIIKAIFETHHWTYFIWMKPSRHGCSKKWRLYHLQMGETSPEGKTSQCSFNTTSYKVKIKCITSILDREEKAPKMCTEQKNKLLNCIFLYQILLALQCNSIFNSLRTSSSPISSWSFFFPCWHAIIIYDLQSLLTA